jgi:lipopolysaccharide transport system permease protein
MILRLTENIIMARPSIPGDDQSPVTTELSGRSSKTELIKPRPGWRSINFKELWNYQDLLYFLVWRDIKTRYAQSVFGVGWAIIQPFMMMIVFTVVFGNLAEFESDGLPFPVFTYAALVPWAYFANSFTDSASSLIRNAEMVKKIYFPRLMIPLSSVVAKLLDFAIALVLLGGLMVWYGIVPTWSILTLPLLLLMMVTAAAGLGMIFTALAVQYRDVSYGLGFAVQMMMYSAPVVYSVSAIPEKYRLLYALNPMVGVIEGFRAALLGHTEMPWDLIGISAAVSIAMLVAGAFYFKRVERIFADVA